MMPQITVIVPVYNVEPYLHRCVDSILAQTYTDFELILVDDGSPDNCPAICDAYAAQDERVKVIHQQNGGLSAARNAGLNSAKGQYIAFVDSDDYIYPTFLERLYQVIEENDADISICRMIDFVDEIPQIDATSLSYTIYKNTEICCMLCDYRKAVGIVAACGKLYKRKFFDNVRFPVGRLHEDQFVAHQIMYASHKIVICEDCLYGYFYNPKGITKNFSVRRYDNALALEEAKKFYLENGEYELAEKAEQLKKLVIAFYTISANKNKVCRDVPKEYRMGLITAWREIRKQMGYDYYEWYLASQSLLIARIQAKVRSMFKTKLKRNKRDMV